MSVGLGEDPFEKKIQQQINSKKQSKEEEDNKEILNIDQNSKPIIAIGDVSMEVDTSFMNKNAEFMEDEIIRNFTLRFHELIKSKRGTSAVEELASNGLWRIEFTNIFEGGILEWENTYRFKHLTSGRYLKIRRTEVGNVVELSPDIDNNCLFYMVPIRNLLKDDQQQFIAKDSYFRLQHVATKLWIGLRNDSDEEDGLRAEIIDSDVPICTEKGILFIKQMIIYDDLYYISP